MSRVCLRTDLVCDYKNKKEKMCVVPVLWELVFYKGRGLDSASVETRWLLISHRLWWLEGLEIGIGVDLVHVGSQAPLVVQTNKNCLWLNLEIRIVILVTHVFLESHDWKLWVLVIISSSALQVIEKPAIWWSSFWFSLRVLIASLCPIKRTVNHIQGLKYLKVTTPTY